MLILLNNPLRRDAPALPKGEPFFAVNACKIKPLTPGEVDAARQTERGRQGFFLTPSRMERAFFVCSHKLVGAHCVRPRSWEKLLLI